MSQKRDVRLDKLRIISMLLVITVHAANRYCRAVALISPASFAAAAAFNVLSRVSVPIFFMISGAVLLGKEYDPKKNRKRIALKFAALLTVTVIYFFWEWLMTGEHAIDPVSLIYEPQRTLLWFMYALLGIYIVLPFIKRMTDGMDNREDRLFIILFAVFGGLLYHIGLKFKFPVPIVGATYYLGYFVSGHIIYKNLGKYDLKRYNVLRLVITLLCVAAATVIVSVKCIGTKTFSGTMLSYRNVFIMISSYCIFVFLYSVLPEKETAVTRALSPLTFGVYLFHGIALDAFMTYFPYCSVFSTAGIPVAVAAAFAVTAVFVYLIRKIPGVSSLF